MTFQWHTPSVLEEVHSLLRKHGDEAKLIAGGTGLVLLMKQKLVQPGHLISLNHIAELDTAKVEDGYLRLGATLTHREVETSGLVKETTPLLAEAFRHVATVRIREMATVGGGLAHADPAEDIPPALLALDASVRLTSAESDRMVPLEDFFQDYYTTALEPEEVLTEVWVPIPLSETRFSFQKFLPRTADDYRTAIIAVALKLDEGGNCQSIRIALGSAGPIPLHAHMAEEMLLGQEITPKAIREAAESVKSEIDPISDVRGSAEYKREMSAVFTRRALEQALARANGWDHEDSA